MTGPLDIVLVGLTITSSWGNGHATNYRALMKELARRGHRVTFLERDADWYARHRDAPNPPHGTTHLYGSLDELRDVHGEAIRDADLVVVGSYVPEGIEVGRWVTDEAQGATAFYDIDTPVTLAALEAGTCSYLSPDLPGAFDVYLSFTGGPTLDVLVDRWGARRAAAFYCMVDEEMYQPVDVAQRWALGYLGTYGADRQPALDALLVDVARAMPDDAFVIGGPQYPDTDAWPPNLTHLDHVAPADHPAFYSAQRFTVNVTRADMVRAGWSPSVRLFEAAACGVPIISDRWRGIEEFFTPGREIHLAGATADVLDVLRTISDDERAAMADAARRRVLREHTAARRAEELEAHARMALARRRRSSGSAAARSGTRTV